MSKWIYDRHTKIKMGIDRYTWFVDSYFYKCPDCRWSIRVDGMQKPPRFCPMCQKDMKEGE